jgi:hypothetical protein
MHEDQSCGGQALDILDNLTPAEAAACRTEVLSWAAAQGGVCN